VAVQVRVITDSSAHEPAVVLSLKLTVGELSQLSVAVTVGADGNRSSQLIVASEGTPLNTGAVLSETLIV
jgi:hypothetical protein